MEKTKKHRRKNGEGHVVDEMRYSAADKLESIFKELNNQGVGK